jgi:hypothetical protein
MKFSRRVAKNAKRMDLALVLMLFFAVSAASCPRRLLSGEREYLVIYINMILNTK